MVPVIVLLTRMIKGEVSRVISIAIADNSDWAIVLTADMTVMLLPVRWLMEGNRGMVLSQLGPGISVFFRLSLSVFPILSSV